jgi:hypothetical protein
MYAPRIQLQLIEGHARRKARQARRAKDETETTKWEGVLSSIQACNDDESICLVVCEELRRSGAKRGFASDGEMLVGELGDGKILEQIKAFLEWLLSDETITQLQKFIKMIIDLFSGL